MPFDFTYKNFYEIEDKEGSDKYWGNEAAGCIFIAKDSGRILFAHRSPNIVFEPNTWAGWGGKIDNNESPSQTVEREVEEETGLSGDYKINHVWTYEDPESEFKYYNYVVIVPHEFTPKLNWENDNSKWVEYGEWPQPLHYGMKALFSAAGSKIKQIVDLIKKRNEKSKVQEAAIDLPPAHVQQVKAQAPNQSIVTQQKLKDAYVVVGTVWEEAKGEGKTGMHAVLNVIMNRAKGDISRARDESLKPKQFSIWNNVSDPEGYCIRLAKRAANEESFQIAVQLVDAAMKGNLPDITGGATHYYNPKKANPSWANALQRTKVIGNHIFMKPKPVSKNPQATKSSKPKTKIIKK
jgi:N-acetylmuramoyl-L-alanine amidase